MVDAAEKSRKDLNLALRKSLVALTLRSEETLINR